jgi:hypothetical protein
MREISTPPNTPKKRPIRPVFNGQPCLLLLLRIFLCAFVSSDRLMAQSSTTLVPSPLDAAIINNIIPTGTCKMNFSGPGVDCSYSLTDEKTGWHTTIDGLTDDRNKPNCVPFVYTCTYRLNFIHLQGANVVSLPKPSIDSIADGVTFRLKVLTLPRANVSQPGTILSMNEVWDLKTIGPRLALQTHQQSPAQTGSEYVITPWEPYTHSGNTYLYEDIYIRFTGDGRVRFDKFTPYYTGTIWTSTHYIWEESVNDGGWPSTWTNGVQKFLPVSNLILGGASDPTTIANSGTDEFRELTVYNKELSRDEMIQEENFDHPAGANLAKGMSPCNTGNWMNAKAVSTPCGSGGAISPIPLPPTNIKGFSDTTDSFAPDWGVSDDGQGNLNETWAPAPQAPPLSLIQDPSMAPPWTPFFPLTNTGYTRYLILKDAAGFWTCIGLPGSQSHPAGETIAIALGADYPETALNGPNTVATASWVNPSPASGEATVYHAIPPGWTCSAMPVK